MNRLCACKRSCLSSSRAAAVAKVTAVPVARQWGASWGKRKGHVQQQPAEKSANTSANKTASQALTIEDACIKLSEAVTAEFVQRNIIGACLPASAVLLEAIEALDSDADARPELCYLEVIDESSSSTFIRHMQVSVNGRPFDIGADIARAHLTASGKPFAPHTSTYTLPPGANYLGWCSNPQGHDGRVIGEELQYQQLSPQQEAMMLAQEALPAARGQWLRRLPPHLLEARQQVLAVSQQLKEALHTT